MARQIAGFAAAIAFLALAFAAPAVADEAPGMQDMIQQEIEAYFENERGSDFRLYWKNGIKFQAWNGKVKGAFFGRLQLDGTFIADQDDTVTAATGVWHSGIEFRRARMGVEAEILKYTKVKFELDFSGVPDEFSFKDVYFQLKNLDQCFGCVFPSIKVGHYKVPQGLEVLTSSRHLTFLELALPSVFAPEREVGVELHTSLMGDRITAAAGLWWPTDDGESLEFRDGHLIGGRLTFLPWAPCDCETRFLHLGVSYVMHDVGRNDTVRFRQRPEIHLGPRIVDTGAITVNDGWDVLGAELAFVYDKFHLMAEYYLAMVDAPGVGDPDFSGWYVEAGYFLNGGTRAFNRSGAKFDRPEICSSFDCTEGAWGTWQVAGRYSWLDLNDAAVNGGEVSDVTFGLNWYLNPNFKIQFNYVYSDVTDAQGVAAADGSISAFLVRFAVDW